MRIHFSRSLVLFLTISSLLLFWSLLALLLDIDYPRNGLWGLGRPLLNLWFGIALIGFSFLSFRRRTEPIWARASASIAFLLFATLLMLDNVPRLLTNLSLSVLQQQTINAVAVWCLIGGYVFLVPMLIYIGYRNLRIPNTHSTNHHS